MTFNWKTFAVGMLIVMLTVSVRVAMHERDVRKITEVQLEQSSKLLGLANATIKDMLTRQRDAAALDEKYTKELADANAENAALQRKLDNGGRVLVKGKCPVPAKTSSTGVDDVGTIELSPVAGRNVLGIRAGIKQDQSALRGLQDYIRQQ